MAPDFRRDIDLSATQIKYPISSWKPPRRLTQTS
jgi:hypothetical protein